jgi:hypothetical protein
MGMTTDGLSHWQAESEGIKLLDLTIGDLFWLILKMISVANLTFEGTFYLSQASKVVDIPHREEKKDCFCGIFPYFLNSPPMSHASSTHHRA